MSNVIEADVWQGILHSIKSKLSQESFNTWFQPLAFEGLDKQERVIHLKAPNPVIKNWVTTNYSSLVDESLAEVSLDGYLIGWSTDENEASSGTHLHTMMDSPETNNSSSSQKPEGSSVQVSQPPAAFAAVGQKRA